MSSASRSRIDRAILGAIQPLERAAAGRRRPRPARPPALRATSASASSTRAVGPPAAGRRHLPGAQLADHLLGDSALLARSGHLEGLQRHVATAHAVVMAGRARPRDHALRAIHLGGACVRGQQFGFGRHRWLLPGRAPRKQSEEAAHDVQTPSRIRARKHPS